MKGYINQRGRAQAEFKAPLANVRIHRDLYVCSLWSEAAQEEVQQVTDMTIRLALMSALDKHARNSGIPSLSKMGFDWSKESDEKAENELHCILPQWVRLNMDSASRMQGAMFLVDHRYTCTTLPKLRQTCIQLGIPEYVSSKCRESYPQDDTRMIRANRVLVTPFFPKSNGLAERVVRPERVLRSEKVVRPEGVVQPERVVRIFNKGFKRIYVTVKAI